MLLLLLLEGGGAAVVAAVRVPDEEDDTPGLPAPTPFDEGPVTAPVPRSLSFFSLFFIAISVYNLSRYSETL